MTCAKMSAVQMERSVIPLTEIVSRTTPARTMSTVNMDSSATMLDCVCPLTNVLVSIALSVTPPRYIFEWPRIPHYILLPATLSCCQTGITCPDGKECNAQGVCIPTNKCKNVSCPPGQACDSADGLCYVEQTCANDLECEYGFM